MASKTRVIHWLCVLFSKCFLAFILLLLLTLSWSIGGSLHSDRGTPLVWLNGGYRLLELLFANPGCQWLNAWSWPHASPCYWPWENSWKAPESLDMENRPSSAQHRGQGTVFHFLVCWLLSYWAMLRIVTSFWGKNAMLKIDLHPPS